MNKSDITYDLLRDREQSLVAFLGLTAFLVRTAFLCFSDNISGAQPMLNIITSLHVFHFPGILHNVCFQPLPLYLYSLFISIAAGGDQLISARLLSVLAGSLTVVPFYYLTKKMFNARIAAVSGLVLCFYPVHLVSSVLTLPDAEALFLILCALWCLSSNKMAMAAVFTVLACAAAYISWLVIPAAVIFILIREARTGAAKRGRTAGLFLAAVIIFPALWACLLGAKYGRGLFYHNFFAAKSFLHYLFGVSHSTFRILGELIRRSGWIFAFFGFLGILRGARIKKQQPQIFYFAIFLLLCSAGIFRREIPVISEGILLLSILLIPFALAAALWILKLLHLRAKGAEWLVAGSFCLCLLFPVLQQRPLLPQTIRDLSSWLGENVTPNETVFMLPDRGGFYSSIIMLSGLPQGNFYRWESGEKFDRMKNGLPDFYLVTAEATPASAAQKDISLKKVIGNYRIFEVRRKR